MEKCIIILAFIFILVSSCSQSRKISFGTSQNFERSLAANQDTIIYTGAIHDAVHYAEDENCIISVKLLSDTTLLCRITKKTDTLKCLTKPLSTTAGNTKMHLVSPSAETYEAYLPHGSMTTEKVRVGETAEGVYNLLGLFDGIGLLYYAHKRNNFFVQNGDYKIQWEFFYWIDSKTKRSLKIPPLIFHNTISEDSLKVLSSFR